MNAQYDREWRYMIRHWPLLLFFLILMLASVFGYNEYHQAYFQHVVVATIQLHPLFFMALMVASGAQIIWPSLILAQLWHEFLHALPCELLGYPYRFRHRVGRFPRLKLLSPCAVIPSGRIPARHALLIALPPFCAGLSAYLIAWALPPGLIAMALLCYGLMTMFSAFADLVFVARCCSKTSPFWIYDYDSEHYLPFSPSETSST